jgi:hypothetical protein
MTSTSLYVSSLNGLLVNNNSVPDPTTVPMPATLPWNDPVDGQNYTFSSSDLQTEAGLLKNELGNLLQGVTFVNAVTPYITGNTSNYVTTILTAASDAAGELEQPDSASINLNMSNLSNLAGALFSLGALGFDEDDFPIMALASGVLWAAGSSQIVNPSPSGIPDPWSTITTQISTLTKESQNIVSNTGFAWATVQDNVFSDQNKLNAFAYNADNGWASSNQQGYQNITPAIQASAQISFYTQLFGSINEIDSYAAYPYTSTTNPGEIYTWGIPGCYEGSCMYTCVDVYPSNLPQEGWTSYPSIISGPHNLDFYIIGGPIKNNGSDSVSEKFPTQTQLDTLFGNATGQFDLPLDMFYSANGPLQRRTGTQNPNRGWDFCSPKGSTTFNPKSRS